MTTKPKKITQKTTRKSKAAPAKNLSELKAVGPEAKEIDEKSKEAIKLAETFQKQAVPPDEPRLGIAGRDRYFEAVGRRKTAVARVRLFTKSGDFTVNDKLYSFYFSTTELLKIAEDALQKMKLLGRFKVSARIKGGGLHAQAEALRLGLARCLVKFNPDFRKRLRRAEFLKRDPRMKERKKPGLKRARKAPQWAKR